jgi:ketosteroid isomerase-like protein
MPDQPAGALTQRAQLMLDLFDSMAFSELGAMLTDDAQSVDEISRGWRRGRESIGAYMSQLKDTVSDVHSRMSEPHEAVWGDVGLVTFVLEQSYTMDGQKQTLEAPTSILFRRQEGDWRIALIHTVPLPEQA